MTDTAGSLDGRAALVTGGGTGIGLGCAARLAADGAVVTICGRRREVLQAAAEQLGERGRFVVCDVQDENQVGAAVAAAAEPLGGLHIVVVNAGGGLTAGPIVTGDVAGWRSQLDVNVIGAFLTIKHAAPAIAGSGGGAIVAISSIAGSHTHRHLAAYSVSKAALDMLVRNAADELGEFGVRVNAVRPGLVPTDASQPLDADPATRADSVEEDLTGTIRHLLDPQHVVLPAAWMPTEQPHQRRVAAHQLTRQPPRHRLHHRAVTQLHDMTVRPSPPRLSPARRASLDSIDERRRQ